MKSDEEIAVDMMAILALPPGTPMGILAEKYLEPVTREQIESTVTILAYLLEIAPETAPEYVTVGILAGMLASMIADSICIELDYI